MNFFALQGTKVEDNFSLVAFLDQGVVTTHVGFNAILGEFRLFYKNSGENIFHLHLN